MELKKIMEKQKEFDQAHRGKVEFFSEITEENINDLEHLLVCLFGEIGELANLTKKIVRGDFSFAEARKDISEEVVDSFIYLIKICNQMNIDLEEEYIKKMKKNRKKFQKYER